MKKNVKKISIISGVSLLMVISMISVSAASYSYNTTRSDAVASAYTKASNDRTSTTLTSTRMLKDNKTTRTSTTYGQEEYYGYSTAYSGLPSDSLYFTIAKGEHKVGNNTYYESEYKPAQ